MIGQYGDGSWLLISQDDESDWVSSSLMDTTDLTGVPVVNVPPPSSSGGSGSGGPSATSAAPTATSSGGGGGGGGQTTPADEHISTEVNIKNDSQSFNGVLSYPDGDTLDQIFVRVVGRLRQHHNLRRRHLLAHLQRRMAGQCSGVQWPVQRYLDRVLHG